jgi:hypothetical protein
MPLRKRVVVLLVTAALFAGVVVAGEAGTHYWDRHFAPCQDYPPPGSGIRNCYDLTGGD